MVFGTGSLATGRNDVTLEVHPPEAGLEVNEGLHNRWSRSGLEVFSGPVVVSEAEKQRALAAGAAYKHGLTMTDEKEVAEESSNRKTIWGVQRRVCFLFLIVVVLIVVSAVTLGAVLGLKERRGSGDLSG